MIILKDLHKHYGDLKAVDNVSAEISQGECIGLLGLNGAGKTTLLKMLSCLLLPTAGSISIDGADMAIAAQSVRKKFGFLPETPPLYEEMTIRQFLEFVARLRGVSEEDLAPRVSEVAKQFRLVDVIEQRIETLSWGYKKRVGIAQAIIHKPQIVILDEPIAGLDPAQIVQMRELIHKLRGQHTIILSSHILSEISQTCDRIFIMHRGQIIASGTEEELVGGLNKEQTLSVILRGDPKQAGKVLDDITAIEKWEVVSQDHEELNLIIRVKGERRAELSAAFVQGGLGLLEISKKQDQLESMFLQLTGGRESQP
jgi:ABC-2 type transport system ATP-binding protein